MRWKPIVAIAVPFTLLAFGLLASYQLLPRRMDELEPKLRWLLHSYETSSSLERRALRLKQLHDYLDAKQEEEQRYRQELSEEITSLTTQIEHFNALLGIRQPSTQAEYTSLIAHKEALRSEYQEKQQFVIQLQNEIGSTVEQLKTISLTFQSADEHRHFVATLPENPNSVHHLLLLKDCLQRLLNERENYAQMKRDCLDKIAMLDREMYNVASQMEGIEHKSLSELKSQVELLTTARDSMKQEIEHLLQSVQSDWQIVEQLKDGTLDCLVDGESRPELDPALSLEAQLRGLHDRALRLQQIKRLIFEQMFEAEYKILKTIWTALDVPTDEQEAFFQQIDKYSPKGVQAIRDEITKLTPIYELAELICQKYQKRLDFIQKMKDFEVKASDPKRLFGSSFQLLEEERFRNTAYPFLLQLEATLKSSLYEYKNLTGNEFRNLLVELEQEIRDRLVRETFFIFREPHSSKRARNEGENATPKQTNINEGKKHNSRGNPAKH